MAYIGQIKERLSLEVTVKGIFHYEKPDFTGWSKEYHTIYIFEDSDSNTFKCDTTSTLVYDPRSRQEKNDWTGFEKCQNVVNGDIITIKGTVKDHSEYKGTEQTVLNRVTVTSIISKVETFEEKQERLQKEKEQKKQDQLDSLNNKDFIWRMPYRQYKDHYSDCETVIDSYDSGVSEMHRYSDPTIAVIIREGRLKNSGVRGEHFHSYELVGEDGRHYVYKAVDEDHAVKRCKKENGNQNYTLQKMYL